MTGTPTPSLLLLAACLIPWFASRPAKRENFNELMMRSTFAIKGQNPGSNTLNVGAAFLVSSEVKGRLGTIDTLIFLVTAGHVLDSIRGDTATIALRRKLADGTVEKDTALFQVRNHGSPLWSNPDPTADVAVLEYRPPAWSDHEAIPIGLLATDQILMDSGIGPGDEVKILGFPFGFGGNSAGYPLLRSGAIANFPLVPETTYAGMLDLVAGYGFSGGPVYTCRSYGNRQTCFVLGLVGGRFVARYFSTQGELVVQSLDLTSYTPSTYVLDAIDSLLATQHLRRSP